MFVYRRDDTTSFFQLKFLQCRGYYIDLYTIHCYTAAFSYYTRVISIIEKAKVLLLEDYRHVSDNCNTREWEKNNRPASLYSLANNELNFRTVLSTFTSVRNKVSFRIVFSCLYARMINYAKAFEHIILYPITEKTKVAPLDYIYSSATTASFYSRYNISIILRHRRLPGDGEKIIVTQAFIL